MKIVCVLDLDETLGFYDKYSSKFLVRPYAETLIRVLHYSSVDIILWSYGADKYVKNIINYDLPIIKKYAYKIFARTQCTYSKTMCDTLKCSKIIRSLYKDQDIYLIAVDDNVNTVMDSNYNLRINIEPYNTIDKNDKHLADAIEKIFAHIDS